MAEFAARNRPDVRGLSAAAARALEAHDWPGNIRELRNVVERGVALCPGSQVGLDDLPRALRGPGGDIRPAAAPQPAPGQVPAAATLAGAKERAEAAHILEVLGRTANNRLRAAAELGISRMTLYKKLHKYGLMGA